MTAATAPADDEKSQSNSSTSQAGGGGGPLSIAQTTHLEANVATQASLVVLHVLDRFIHVFRYDLEHCTNVENAFFQSVVQLYVGFARLHQSECAQRHYFASMRVFIQSCGRLLFSSCHAALAQLCEVALRGFNSRLSGVRHEAAGFLFRMMRTAWTTHGRLGFSRIHLQIVISVSRLVGQIGPDFEHALTHLGMLAQCEAKRQQQNAASKPSVSARRPAPALRSPNTATPGAAGGTSATEMEFVSDSHSTTQTAAGGAAKTTLFLDEIKDLIKRIRTVLMATVQIRSTADPELLVDLQNSLAKSYATNVSLRKTWLEEIDKAHQNSGNSADTQAEQAMVKVHIAAMIAEHLWRSANANAPGASSSPSAIRINPQLFLKISPNISLEENISTSAPRKSSTSSSVTLAKQSSSSASRAASSSSSNTQTHTNTSSMAESLASIQLEFNYSRDDVVRLLQEAALLFSRVGAYEAMQPCFDILLPVFQHERDHLAMSRAYEQLAKGFARAHLEENPKAATSRTAMIGGAAGSGATGGGVGGASNRCFAAYYRVTLIGRPFENLAGRTFVYRVRPEVKLKDMTDQLLEVFSRQYGGGGAAAAGGGGEVVKISETTFRTKELDLDKANVQVISVTPYFEEAERATRKTEFERQFNINQFMVEIPFTKPCETADSSGARNQHDKETHQQEEEGEENFRPGRTEDVGAQWKRRTILKTEAFFPHFRRRLEVVSSQNIDVTPIEMAIESMQEKNAQLAAFLDEELLEHIMAGKHRAALAASSGSVSSSTNSLLLVEESGSIGSSSKHSQHTASSAASSLPAHNKSAVMPRGSVTGGGGGGGGGVPVLMDMYLSGALLPQVNQGPMAYTRVFLDRSATSSSSSTAASSSSKYPERFVAALMQQFLRFFSVCGKLLLQFEHLAGSAPELEKLRIMKAELEENRVRFTNLVMKETVVDEITLEVSFKSADSVPSHPPAASA